MLSHIHRPKKPYRMGRLPEPTVQPCNVCGLASTGGSVCILCKPSCLKSPEREHQLAKAKTMDEWIAAYLLPDVPDEVKPEATPNQAYQDFIFGKRGLPSSGPCLRRYGEPVRHFGFLEDDYDDYCDHYHSDRAGAF